MTWAVPSFGGVPTFFPHTIVMRNYSTFPAEYMQKSHPHAPPPDDQLRTKADNSETARRHTSSEDRPPGGDFAGGRALAAGEP